MAKKKIVDIEFTEHPKARKFDPEKIKKLAAQAAKTFTEDDIYHILNRLDFQPK